MTTRTSGEVSRKSHKMGQPQPLTEVVWGGGTMSTMPGGYFDRLPWAQRRGITTDTALRLARAFESTPAFWLNLQTAHDLRRTEIDHGSEIAAEVVALAKSSKEL